MKLLTQEILRAVPALYGQEDRGREAKVHAKYFTPWSNWRWYMTEYDPETGRAFGLVSGMAVEFGYFMLSELEELRGPVGLRVERDLYGAPETIGEALSECESRGEEVPSL